MIDKYANENVYANFFFLIFYRLVYVIIFNVVTGFNVTRRRDDLNDFKLIFRQRFLIFKDKF